MKNFKNRVLSGILAGALAVSMAVPAFASETVLTGAYAEPNIEVTVPETGTVTINPYGMPIEMDTGVSITGAQIVTSPLALINNGATDLKVSATVTAEATGDLRFATSKPSSSDTSKSAYVYLQMTSSDLDVNNVSNAAGNVSGLYKSDIAAAVAAWEQSAYTSSKDLLLSGTTAATKNNMLTLKAAAIPQGGTTLQPQAGSIGLFRLAGQVTASPREAWTTDDGFTATIAFTFAPDSTTASIDKPTAAVTVAAGTNHTATLTVSLNGATITDVEWESGTPANATVVKNTTNPAQATVTAVAAGTSTVTATIKASNGLTYTATCNVTVTAS